MSFRAGAPAIVELLESHHAAPFPDECRTRVVDGVGLAALDADVIGLASSSLANGGVREAQRLMLEGCLTDAERVLPLLGGAERLYFLRVHDLAAAVLRADAGLPAA